MSELPRLFLVLGVLNFLNACATEPTSWSEVATPAPGQAQSIGAYSGGCIVGAVPLPANGMGYRVMHLSSGRFYGHPTLIRFIQALGERVAAEGLGMLLIGDLGQSRGGPIPSGHRSHQNGLDADIGFQRPSDIQDRHLHAAEREHLRPVSMLTLDRQSLDPHHWSSLPVALLNIMAGFEEVERIFVNPLIKRELCRQVGHKGWLRKLRPWWGHDAHFHVRLRCPEGETLCLPQAPLPAGDGCDATLEWWFSEEAKTPAQHLPPALPVLPAACRNVLHSLREPVYSSHRPLN
jgi:penicillin-insensitive murein DD-endopeptidase